MNISKLIHEKVVNNELSDENLVQLLEQIGLYLNLQTIPNYAKVNNISYNGVKKFRKIVKIFDIKFVIDND